MKNRMFGTAGIRGVTNIEITPELAKGIASAYGYYLSKGGRKGCKVAVGFDTRYGAEVLALSAITGLTSIGIDVVNLGCISTGGFSMNMVAGKLDGGILITGSHMPPDRIGIIAMLKDGAYAPFEVTDKIEYIYNHIDKMVVRVKPEKIGAIVYPDRPLNSYVDGMLNALDISTIRNKRYKVLIDSANGTATLIARDFFEKLGCEVYEINGRVSPVPNRPSEPRAKNVKSAIEAVIDNKCDIGLCFDIDADRVLFISKEGDAISEDTVGAIFAAGELSKGDLCVTPINSSCLIELVCKNIGAKVRYCTIGQPPTVKTIKRYKARFAYEESGKYYFCKTFLWCDGVFAGAKMLELMAKSGKSLHKLVSPLPRFYQIKHTVAVTNVKKRAVMIRVKKIWQREAINGRLKDVTIDGLKRLYRDNSWLLIRESGTEPLIRVYSDAPSMKRAEDLVRIGEDIVRRAL